MDLPIGCDVSAPPLGMSTLPQVVEALLIVEVHTLPVVWVGRVGVGKDDYRGPGAAIYTDRALRSNAGFAYTAVQMSGVSLLMGFPRCACTCRDLVDASSRLSRGFDEV